MNKSLEYVLVAPEEFLPTCQWLLVEDFVILARKYRAEAIDAMGVDDVMRNLKTLRTGKASK